MKFFFWGVVVLGSLLVTNQLFAEETKGPKLVIKEMQFDFGKVAQGTVVSHVFEIKNAGNEPLIIERVVPS